MSVDPSQNSLDADTNVDQFVLETSHAPCAASDDATQRGGSIPLIAGYEVIRELGRGGMGVVYLARDQALDRLVALKTLRVDKSGQYRQILTAEAKLCGKLSHTGIVPVFEVNVACETPYFSMAYIGGVDLAQQLSKQVYAPRDAAQLGIQMSAAMQHAHDAGVLHLDLKPANILLCGGAEAKITDFGLFALVGNSSSGQHGVVGTPQFMSPEQALNDAENISIASDVYSLGAVLYAALTGRPPLVASNDTELVMKVASQRPRPVGALVSSVPAALDAIVMKCLEKAPSKRYASASELQCDLQAFLDGKPVSARPPNMLGWFRYQFQHHVLAASVSGSLVLLLMLFSVASLGLQAVNNHYDVQRLSDEVQSLRRVNTMYGDALLKRVAQSSVDQTVIDELTTIAQELFSEGKFKRAAIIAADSYLLADVHQGTSAPELALIIRSYNPDWTADSSLSISEMASIISDENKYTKAGLAAQDE